MSARLQVTFDVAEPARLAEFWATADPEGNEFCLQ